MAIQQMEPVMHADWPHPTTMAVAVVMAWNSSASGDVRMMQAEIARQMRASRQTVSREVTRLVACGVLEEVRRNRWRWRLDALADLDAALARYEETAATPATLRGVVKPRAEPRTTELDSRGTQQTRLAAILAERQALEARHGPENVYGGDDGLELVAPHTDDDDCIALDPMPVAVE